MANAHTVLVVDDEADVVRSVQDLLRFDYRVLGQTVAPGTAAAMSPPAACRIRRLDRSESRSFMRRLIVPPRAAGCRALVVHPPDVGQRRIVECPRNLRTPLSEACDAEADGRPHRINRS